MRRLDISDYWLGRMQLVRQILATYFSIKAVVRHQRYGRTAVEKGVSEIGKKKKTKMREV